MSTKSVQSSGFTLVETLIVVVLLGILASVVMPALSSSASSQLRGAAAIMAGDFQYVQAEAVNMGQTLQIQFPGGDEYRVYGPDGDGDGQPDLLRHPQSDSPAHYNAVKGYSEFIVSFDDPGPLTRVTIESAQFGGQRMLEFGRFGEPTASGEVVLRCEGLRVRITVAAITGLVTIGDLEKVP
jgi:prepilin-type N-terminal cleavage/methylation domain-containing protein